MRKIFLRGFPLLLLSLAAASSTFAQNHPNILLITVDTLRADRLSGYGYERPTSPNLDRLTADGVRFTQARTAAPLTCPALTSMFTALHPHEHGATRNGLRSRERLPTFPKLLRRAGYESAAVISNWVLRDQLCGLAEHFDTYLEVLIARQGGVGDKIGDAEHVNEATLKYLREYKESGNRRPFFLWTHYMEPHFPYDLQEEHLEDLGLGRLRTMLSPANRYDTEVAKVDLYIGKLLKEVAEMYDPANTMIIFTSDHGESLGHHDYWGHGHHVYDASLHIPFSITWPGKIEPGVVEGPSINLDVGPTILGLLGLPVPSVFQGGFDFSPVLRGEIEASLDRVTYHQGHRGTVSPEDDRVQVRTGGLLEVGIVEGKDKEMVSASWAELRVFDLVADPLEKKNLVKKSDGPSAALRSWMDQVRRGLAECEDLPVPALDQETLDALESLGYLD